MSKRKMLNLRISLCFLFFSSRIVVSGWELTFQKLSTQPAPDQVQEWSAKPNLPLEKWKLAKEVILRKQMPEIPRVSFAFDYKRKMAACVAQLEQKYVLICADNDDTERGWHDYIFFRYAPLMLGITGNIILYCDTNRTLFLKYFSKNGPDYSYKVVDTSSDQASSKIFNEFRNELTQEDPPLCFSGKEVGSFYFRRNEAWYLLTIKQKENEPKITPQNNGAAKAGTFWTYKRVLFFGLLCVGLICLVKMNIKNLRFMDNKFI